MPVSTGLPTHRLRKGIAPGSIVSAALRHLSNLHRMRLTVEDGQSGTGAVEGARPPIHCRRKSSIDTALRALTGDGARVYIALLYDQTKLPYATSTDGAGLSPEGVAHMSRLAGDFNSIISAKAKQYGATTVDFSNTQIITDASSLADDGIHPNEKGYDAIAQVWFEAISKEIK